MFSVMQTVVMFHSGGGSVVAVNEGPQLLKGILTQFYLLN